MEILIDNKKILERIKELAREIENHYQDKDLILICILTGSVPFLTHLMQNINLPLQVDYLQVKSYQGDKNGEIQFLKDINLDISNKDVLVVEDIIDTGLTLQFIKEYLLTKNVKSLKTIALLDKYEKRQTQIDADFIGFKIEDKFVVGFGLDFNENYRNLPFVGVL